MNWQQELLEQASAAAKAVKPKPAVKVRLDASATHARSRFVRFPDRRHPPQWRSRAPFSARVPDRLSSPRA
jgi:hypothetical protein